MFLRHVTLTFNNHIATKEYFNFTGLFHEKKREQANCHKDMDKQQQGSMLQYSVFTVISSVLIMCID